MVQQSVWIGIDVGRYWHAWCALDAGGAVCWKQDRVINTTLTMRAALAKLQAAFPDCRLIFALEEPHGNATALVRLLTQLHQVVVLTPPLRVHRFHEAVGQPHKSDPYDAKLIAEYTRQNEHRLRLLRTEAIPQQCLRVLSRRLDAIGKDLRREVCRLRATLAEYAPEWLVCGVFSDWSGATALATLERYGRLSMLAKTPLGRLAAAFQRWSRRRMGRGEAQRLQEALAPVSLPPQLEVVFAEVLASHVGQVRRLLAEKQRLLSLIGTVGEQLPAVAHLLAERGYGLETAAIIVSEVGESADFASESAFATYAGVTPVMRKSGISAGSSHLARFTNKRLLRAIMQAAQSAKGCDPASGAYYEKKLAGRKDPRSKTRALIALARHRVRRLFHLLRQAATEETSAPSAAALAP